MPCPKETQHPNGARVPDHKRVECLGWLKLALKCNIEVPGISNIQDTINSIATTLKRKREETKQNKIVKKHKANAIKNADDDDVEDDIIILKQNKKNDFYYLLDDEDIKNISSIINKNITHIDSITETISDKRANSVNSHERIDSKRSRIADTGADVTIIKDRDDLINIRTLSRPHTVVTANGTSMIINEIGDLAQPIGSTIRLINNAMVSNQLGSEDLISIGKMYHQYKDKGAIITSRGIFDISLHDEKVRDILANGIQYAEYDNGTYSMQTLSLIHIGRCR